MKTKIKIKENELWQLKLQNPVPWPQPKTNDFFNESKLAKCIINTFQVDRKLNAKTSSQKARFHSLF